MYSQAHIERLYSQGPAAFLRVVRKLEDRLEDPEAQLVRPPQPALKRLMRQVRDTQQTLARRSAELLPTQQRNHQLQQRIRALEQALESGSAASPPPVKLDSHNSHQPPGADPPWRKVKHTRSLREKTGRSAGGQPGHPSATLKPVARPDALLTHTPSACPHCGATLPPETTLTSHRRQVRELLNGRLQVVEHQLGQPPCPSCATLARGSFPAAVKAHTRQVKP